MLPWYSVINLQASMPYEQRWEKSSNTMLEPTTKKMDPAPWPSLIYPTEARLVINVLKGIKYSIWLEFSKTYNGL